MDNEREASSFDQTPFQNENETNVEKCQSDRIVLDSQQVQILLQEKEHMRVEFDSQRAKLKDLFLHKEDELRNIRAEKDKLSRQVETVTTELNELKSQLFLTGLQLENNVQTEKRKAAEEIASLQQLIHETVEESTSSRHEVSKLNSVIQQLEVQIQDLKQQSPHHTAHESTLAPSLVLSAVTKKIGKKLGADFFTSQDEDHKEDHELLKSLIGPLEEEIKALKDKLRATDDELQKCKKQSADPANPSTKETDMNCDMCRNYEDELVREQKRVVMLETKVLTAEKSAERHKEDLIKEIGFRQDMEEKWSENKEVHKKLVAELTTRLEATELDLKELQDTCNRAEHNMRESLHALTEDREMIQRELERLQKENDYLLDKYSMNSQMLQNEFIDLPNTVEELQEVILKMQQDLITAKIGKETAGEENDKLRGELIVIKEQMQNDQECNNEIRLQIDKLETDRRRYEGTLEKYRTRESDAVAKLQNKNAELEKALETSKSLEKKIMDQHSRIASLEQELATSETVQKDYVQVSQTMQN